jgi:hypothetical protein
VDVGPLTFPKFVDRFLQINENAWSMVETSSKCRTLAAQNIAKVGPAVASESLEFLDCINVQFRSIKAVNGGYYSRN